MVNKFFVKAIQEEFELEYKECNSILAALRKWDIPWNSGVLYLRDTEGKLEAWHNLESSFTDIPDHYDLIFFCYRNLDPRFFNKWEIDVIEADSKPSVSSLFYKGESDKLGKQILKKLSSNECKFIVTNAVKRHLKELGITDNGRIVVCVSGGGDSNALLYALSEIVKTWPDFTVMPVMVKGLPEWELGEPRARKLCSDFGFNLEVISQSRLEDLLGFKKSSTSLAERFASFFPGEDLELLTAASWRYLVAEYAKEKNADYVAVGTNLEDLLATVMYSLINGAAAEGIRKIIFGELSFIYPLWSLPKQVIDGCFPEFSLENSLNRAPCNVPGRNLCFQLAYMITAKYPGIGEKMLIGAEKIIPIKNHKGKFSLNKDHPSYDKFLAFLNDQRISSEKVCMD